MKKIVSSVLMLSLISVMLVGCGNKKEEPIVENPPVVETPAPEVEKPIETPEVVETPEIVETPEVNVSMAMIVDTMRNIFGDKYLPSFEMDKESFNMLVGIDASKADIYYNEFYAGMPMMGTHVDKLFVVKTDNTENMKSVFKSYMDAQIADTMQYPMNVTKLENYCLTVYGDYVVLAILGGYTDETPVADETKTPEQLETEQKSIEIAYYTSMNEKIEKALIDLFETGEVPAPISDVVEESTKVDIKEGVGADTSKNEEMSNTSENVENTNTETSNVENSIEETVTDTTNVG